jgi:hypothetical protein
VCRTKEINMSKQVGLSAAIGLVGVGIILNALPKFGIGAATATAAPLVPVAQAGAPTPTIVWYGVSGSVANSWDQRAMLFRAWSDGTIEYMAAFSNWTGQCGGDVSGCGSQWKVLSSPTAGMSAAADSNFDQLVDGADLANLLAAWGPAPRSPIPPSDCPLDLINP